MCLFFDITTTVENCRIKKPSAQVDIWNLINYLATNCWNGKGTRICEVLFPKYGEFRPFHPWMFF